jgi:hypothetical protein
MRAVLRAPVTEAQLEWAQHAATADGLTVAEWLRSLVDRAIGEHRCAKCEPGAARLTIHSVLAGAYKGRGVDASLLTHASADGGETALCGRARNLTDLGEGLPQDIPPTCPPCAARWAQVRSAGARPTTGLACRACAARRRKGLDDPCPVCAQDRARAELARERSQRPAPAAPHAPKAS